MVFVDGLSAGRSGNRYVGGGRLHGEEPEGVRLQHRSDGRWFPADAAKRQRTGQTGRAVFGALDHCQREVSTRSDLAGEVDQSQGTYAGHLGRALYAPWAEEREGLR